MSLLQAVILALVQAATEFLPISSTAHLILVPWLLGWPDHGLLFDIALHLGTLAAVLLYFAKTWIRLLGLAFGRKLLPPPPGDPDHDLFENPKLFWYLVAATFPAGLAGLFLEDYVASVFRSPFVVGVMLVAIGLVLAWAERAGSFRRDLNKISLLDAMLIGCAQAIALIPGTSRSGITISAALFLGIRRAAAARFSFLLSSPIILGATAKTALDVAGQGGIPSSMQAAFLTGITVSALAGYAVIAVFIRYLQSRTLLPFIYYRIIFGIIVLALALFFRFPAAAP
jgi:undecaprenyl-diphosphatase